MTTYNPYQSCERHRRAKVRTPRMSWAEGIKAMLLFYLILVAIVVTTLAMLGGESMMNNQSHQPIWMYCPLAAKPRTRWQRLCDWLEDFFRPIALSEGRRRIDPNEPYGAWSGGFSQAAMPKEKAR